MEKKYLKEYKEVLLNATSLDADFEDIYYALDAVMNDNFDENDYFDFEEDRELIEAFTEDTHEALGLGCKELYNRIKRKLLNEIKASKDKINKIKETDILNPKKQSKLNDIKQKINSKADEALKLWQEVEKEGGEKACKDKKKKKSVKNKLKKIADIKQELKHIERQLNRWQGKGRAKLWQAFKTGNPLLIVARGFILTAIKSNYFNISKKLKAIKEENPKKYEEIKFKFRQMGGDRTKFDKAVEIGAKKKPIRIKLKKKFEGFDYYGGDGDTGGAGNTGGDFVIPTFGTPLAQLLASAIPDASQTTRVALTSGGAVLDGIIVVINGIKLAKDKKLASEVSEAPEVSEDEIKKEAEEIKKEAENEKTKKILIFGGIGLGVLATIFITIKALRK